MKKLYKKLTNDQKNRGIIFSSTLSKETIEQEEDTMHEISTDKNSQAQKETRERLLNDSFFNNSPYNYNIIRK